MLSDYTLAEIARKNAGINPDLQAARPVGNTAALGTITTIGAADLIDGETFTLDDGQNPAVIFEFDKSGDGVTAGRTAVDVSAGEDADGVRDAIIAAVNGLDNDVWKILASDGGAATVTLTNETSGVHGNVAGADTVANVGFVLVGMAGGVDYPTVYPSNNGKGVDTSNASRAVVIVKPKDGASVTFDILSRTQGRNDEFEPLAELRDLEADVDRGFKQIVNCSPEDELAIEIKSGDATLILMEVIIGPCTG